MTFKGKKDEHYRVRNISRMMNVVSARNCVSASHFAAATCHYCTITMCTTIVASRTSFVQSDPIILANLVFEFREARRYFSDSLSCEKSDECNIRCKDKSNRICSSHEESIFSPSIRYYKFFTMKPRILCASPTLYIESYYTR